MLALLKCPILVKVAKRFFRHFEFVGAICLSFVKFVLILVFFFRKKKSETKGFRAFRYFMLKVCVSDSLIILTTLKNRGHPGDIEITSDKLQFK